MNAYNFQINDADEKELAELRTNMKTLLETRAGSQPADRDFGISWECLDELPDIAENLFVVELHEKVERYEPRIKIEEVTFQKKEGALIPNITFSRKEDT